MIFTDEFLEEFKANPVKGAIKIRDLFWQHTQPDVSPFWTKSNHDIAIEIYALLNELIAAELINYDLPNFEITGVLEPDCNQVRDYVFKLGKHFSERERQLNLENFRRLFKVGIGKTFAYEFSQGDFEKIQSLINELRELITRASGLEKEHQRRLLGRLERLQSEMHKKVSDLDRFWGLIGDAGVALGKLGNDAKPIVDRIREIAEITWNTQSRAEELPSGTSLPRLGDKSDGEA